jgi:hypothetical protein
MRHYLLDTAPLAALLLARPAAVDLISPWLNRHEVATRKVVVNVNLENPVRAVPGYVGP